MAEALKTAAPMVESMPWAPGEAASVSATSMATGSCALGWIRRATSSRLEPICPALLSRTYSPGITCSPVQMRISSSMIGFSTTIWTGVVVPAMTPT